jgi:S1-C subfamily serine protease
MSQFPLARVVIALTLIVLASSCATIVTGSRDNVSVESEPPGAEFETSSGQKGTTPAVITIADTETLSVTVTKPGYAPGSASLAPRMSGWVVGNVLIGGLIGLAIDLISGQWRTHDDRIVVKLTLGDDHSPPVASTSDAAIIDASGTGICVHPDGLVVTAYHLVRNAHEISIQFADGTSTRATLENWDANADVAVIRVQHQLSSYLTPGAATAIAPGAHVFTVGFPVVELLGREPKYSEGAINSTTGVQGLEGFIQISIPIQPGNSGGPVITDGGELVGVVVSTAAISSFIRQTGTLPQSVNWASRFENAAHLYPAAPPRAPTTSRESAVERAMKAVCYIQVRETKT